MTDTLSDRIDFSRNDGFITAVTQDARTRRVLMTARVDAEALRQTIASGEMHYHSRSRGLWHKGATSGNRQTVVSLHPDCDGDAILALVNPLGPSCHAGTTSCFGDDGTLDGLRALVQRVTERGDANASGYTRRLLDDRNLRLKKIGEEAGEFVVACADGNQSSAIEEAADLLYHVVVALHAVGATLDDVAGALTARQR